MAAARHPTGLESAGMRRIAIGLGLVLALVAVAMWAQRRPLRQRFSSHVETRQGILVLLEAPQPKVLEHRARQVPAGSHCVLVHIYTPSGSSDLDSLEDRYWASDGLEPVFCEERESQLNHRIQITGIRTTGDAINQDCTNRACFEAVLTSSQ